MKKVLAISNFAIMAKMIENYYKGDIKRGNLRLLYL